MYVKYVMKKLEANQLSNQQNTEILERLFEEAYQEIKEDNILQLNEDDLIFAAKTRAERRFEELPEPGDYDD